MPILDPDRSALLRKILPPLRRPAETLDFFQPQPERLLTKTPIGHLIGLLNWGCEEKTMVISNRDAEFAVSDDVEAYEFWTGRHLDQVVGGSLSISVPPQGCRVLFLRRSPGHPIFLGCDSHLSCGADLLQLEDWDNRKRCLTLKFSSPPGQVTIFVPDGMHPIGNNMHQTGPRSYLVVATSTSLRWQLHFA